MASGDDAGRRTPDERVGKARVVAAIRAARLRSSEADRDAVGVKVTCRAVGAAVVFMADANAGRPSRPPLRPDESVDVEVSVSTCDENRARADLWVDAGAASECWSRRSSRRKSRRRARDCSHEDAREGRYETRSEHRLPATARRWLFTPRPERYSRRLEVSDRASTSPSTTRRCGFKRSRTPEISCGDSACPKRVVTIDSGGRVSKIASAPFASDLRGKAGVGCTG